MAVQDARRVDLIFPRSGQVVHVCVPDSVVQWVARRNLEILLSLDGTAALSGYGEHIRRLHPHPS